MSEHQGTLLVIEAKEHFARADRYDKWAEQERWEGARKLYEAKEQGLTWDQMAREFGKSENHVRRIGNAYYVLIVRAGSDISDIIASGQRFWDLVFDRTPEEASGSRTTPQYAAGVLEKQEPRTLAEKIEDLEDALARKVAKADPVTQKQVHEQRQHRAAERIRKVADLGRKDIDIDYVLRNSGTAREELLEAKEHAFNALRIIQDGDVDKDQLVVPAAELETVVTNIRALLIFQAEGLDTPEGTK